MLRIVIDSAGDLPEEWIERYQIDTIVNFAADTHVDRSIMDPDAFIMTDVYGTYVLEWDITNGNCDSQSEVTINYAEAASAGLGRKMAQAGSTSYRASMSGARRATSTTASMARPASSSVSR